MRGAFRTVNSEVLLVGQTTTALLMKHVYFNENKQWFQDHFE